VSRLAQTFTTLRQRGERALIPYFTAGDPSLADTRRLVVEAARQGADIVEIGVPFSDPLADGPVIQRAAQRALWDELRIPAEPGGAAAFAAIASGAYVPAPRERVCVVVCGANGDPGFFAAER
jgi:tryptophan synthase alpha subunit